MSTAGGQMHSANQALRQMLNAITEGDRILPDKLSPGILQSLRQTLDDAARCRRRAMECGSDTDLEREIVVYRELLIRLQSVLPRLEAGVRKRAETLRQDLARVGDLLAWNHTTRMTKR